MKLTAGIEPLKTNYYIMYTLIDFMYDEILS